jgi:hypothetical protein
LIYGRKVIELKPQEVMIYKGPILKVLGELFGDERLAGCQHFAFVLYKDEKGQHILACDAKLSSPTALLRSKWHKNVSLVRWEFTI